MPRRRRSTPCTNSFAACLAKAMARDHNTGKSEASFSPPPAPPAPPASLPSPTPGERCGHLSPPFDPSSPAPMHTCPSSSNRPAISPTQASSHVQSPTLPAPRSAAAAPSSSSLRSPISTPHRASMRSPNFAALRSLASPNPGQVRASSMSWICRCDTCQLISGRLFRSASSDPLLSSSGRRCSSQSKFPSSSAGYPVSVRISRASVVMRSTQCVCVSGPSNCIPRDLA
jgi:hypothetical protein